MGKLDKALHDVNFRDTWTYGIHEGPGTKVGLRDVWVGSGKNKYGVEMYFVETEVIPEISNWKFGLVRVLDDLLDSNAYATWGESEDLFLFETADEAYAYAREHYPDTLEEQIRAHYEQ